MEPINWAELQAREDRIFEWLRDMGLDQYHRLKAHRRNIDEILQAHKAGRYQEFRDQLSVDDQWARLWSICESLEFIVAMNPLSESRPSGIRHVLKRR